VAFFSSTAERHGVAGRDIAGILQRGELASDSCDGALRTRAADGTDNAGGRRGFMTAPVQNALASQIFTDSCSMPAGDFDLQR
jgi:hypothetical protein